MAVLTFDIDRKKGKEEEKMENKKKMPIVALALLAIVGVVGGTIAYFTSVKEFPNVFKTDVYKTEIEEVFTPEDGENWTPGTEVNKDVFVKNTGNVPVAVRVTMTEEWINAEGETVEKDGKYNGKDVVEKTFVEIGNWIQNGNVYYYNKALTNDQRVQFLDSVKLSQELANTENLCKTTYTYQVGEETKTIAEGEEVPAGAVKVSEKQVCSSDENGYSGLEYKLTIKVETVQYDAYEEYFNVKKADVNIAEA